MHSTGNDTGFSELDEANYTDASEEEGAPSSAVSEASVSTEASSASGAGDGGDGDNSDS